MMIGNDSKDKVRNTHYHSQSCFVFARDLYRKGNVGMDGEGWDRQEICCHVIEEVTD